MKQKQNKIGRKVKNKKRDLREEGVVRVGGKPFFVYIAAIENVLKRSTAVEVSARGRKNIEKATGVIATMTQRRKDLASTGVLTFQAWKGKNAEGKTETMHGAVAVWRVTAKPTSMRIKQVERLEE
jgi:hypothetical protein